ncbi:hypothetical protein A2U01_0108132, partial [Trifolium medium]|nr:hypothetical protein [Trifolium medium]
WAWLAVIFWRIRTPKPELLPPPSSDKPDLVPEVLEPCHDDDDDVDHGGPSSTVVDNSVSEDVVGITKGKMK